MPRHAVAPDLHRPVPPPVRLLEVSVAVAYTTCRARARALAKVPAEHPVTREQQGPGIVGVSMSGVERFEKAFHRDAAGVFQEFDGTSEQA